MQYRRKRALWKSAATILRVVTGLMLSAHSVLLLRSEGIVLESIRGVTLNLPHLLMLSMGIAIVTGAWSRWSVLFVLAVTSLAGLFPGNFPSLIGSPTTSHLVVWLAFAVMSVLAGEGRFGAAKSPIIGTWGEPALSLLEYPQK